MKVGIKQISDKTGYSMATVSNALNHKPGVNRKTYEAIQQAARELGYVNAAKISKIRFVTYKKTGKIIEGTPFFSELIEGVESEAREAGYQTLYTTLNEKSKHFKNSLDDIVADEDSALILLGTEMSDSDYKPYQCISNPVVVVDGWCDFFPMDCVIINNIDASFHATEYLIKNGHSKIGYLKGAYRIKNFNQRSLGFRQALHKYRLENNPEFTVPLAPSIPGAVKDMDAWLRNRKELPTAFFADNDMIALGAMQALQNNGYSIPQDVSIVGFDDLPQSSKSGPALTTVHVYNGDMGRLAVQRLLQNLRSKGGNSRTKNQVYTGFIERGSVLDLNQY